MTKKTTIDDLPNEILDEILGYVHPTIDERPLISTKTVCRKWNRPFMTSHLFGAYKMPDGLDVQALFPRLYMLTVAWDDSLIKGHTYLTHLAMRCNVSSNLLIKYPRLTRLTVATTLKVLFKDHLDGLLIACPFLAFLDLKISQDVESSRDLKRYNAIIEKQSRQVQGLVNMKRLNLKMEPEGIDFIAFCGLFRSTSTLICHLRIISM